MRTHAHVATACCLFSTLTIACATTPQVAKEDEGVAAQVVACDEGIVVACVDLAGRAERGDGVKKDLARATALFTKACDGGHAESCRWVAKHHEATGAGKATTEFLEKACTEGDDAACVRAGRALFAGSPDERKRSAAAFARACERGHAPSCTGQGIFWSTTGVDATHDMKRDETARTYFDKGCKGGDAQGCVNLAFLLEKGRGGFPDKDGADALYQKACEQKNAHGCFNLAVRRRSAGTPERDVEAAQLFDNACALDEPEGCAEVAWHHLRGRGVARDPTRARAFAERACAKKIDKGCRIVSFLDQNPEGL